MESLRENSLMDPDPELCRDLESLKGSMTLSSNPIVTAVETAKIDLIQKECEW